MTETKTENTKVPLTPSMRSKLEAIARAEDRSLAYIIRRAISEYLERTER